MREQATRFPDGTYEIEGTARDILECLCSWPDMTINGLAQELARHPLTIKRAINELRELGLITVSSHANRLIYYPSESARRTVYDRY